MLIIYVRDPAMAEGIVVYQLMLPPSLASMNLICYFRNTHRHVNIKLPYRPSYFGVRLTKF